MKIYTNDTNISHCGESKFRARSEENNRSIDDLIMQESERSESHQVLHSNASTRGRAIKHPVHIGCFELSRIRWMVQTVTLSRP